MVAWLTGNGRSQKSSELALPALTLRGLSLMAALRQPI